MPIFDFVKRLDWELINRVADSKLSAAEILHKIEVFVNDMHHPLSN